MAKIKNKDFVEVEYTGKLKENNTIFDTTDEKTAKESNIFSKKMSYGPIVVCIGEKQLLAGLDKQVEGKETGKTYEIELKPEEAFGKKDAKLLKMIPSRVFKEQGIALAPGLQVSIDGLMGIIRTAAGGRVIVDFNHPLSGKEIVYNIKLNKIITDDKEKIKEYVKLQLNMKDVRVETINNEIKIILKIELPKEITEQFNKKIAELIPTVKKVEFMVEKPKKEKTKKVNKQEDVTSGEEQKK